MPLYQNKYQPYFLDPDSPNREDCIGNYYYPVKLGDDIYAQFYQTPCNANEIADPLFEDSGLGADVITNGSFAANANGWVTTPSAAALPSSGWSWNAGGFVEKVAGTDEWILQSGLTLTSGAFYQIDFDFTRTAGSIQVALGVGALQTISQIVDTSGSYSLIILFSDVLDPQISFRPTGTDFAGTIDNVVMREVIFASWDPNASWYLADGKACHIEGTSGTLEESVTDYILAGERYWLTITASSIQAGSVQVYISNILAGVIDSTGIKQFWAEPTLDGVLSFVPTSDFVGCLELPDLRLMRNDYSGNIIAQDGSKYKLDPYFEYLENYVTLIFNFAQFELLYGCYYIEVFDSCTITGENLATNGNFSQGQTGWTNNNGGQQYDYSGNQLTMIFDPIEGANLLSNGDFATGDFTDWNPGTNWTVVSNKARHTPGSSATLEQTIVIAPLPAPPTTQTYWVQITVSGRTAGSISVTFGNKTKGPFSDNGTLTFSLTPTTSGPVSFFITPTSDFDGDLDDIGITISNVIWSAFPIAFNQANPLMVAGNYEVTFDLVSTSDSRISVGMNILGGAGSTQYFSSIGSHTIQVSNYVPGAQQGYIVGNFSLNPYTVPGTLVIDNINIHRVEPFDATYTSVPMNYQLEQPGTRLVTAYCDENAFGFEFINTGFVLQQRVRCRSLNPIYPSVVNIQNSGNGSGRITYAEQTKFYLFATDFMDESAHDAMSIQLKCDHLLIGQASQVEYLYDGEEYTPRWRGEGDYQLADVLIRLRVKENEQKFNRHIISTN